MNPEKPNELFPLHLIEHEERVIRVFGKWPMFHNAELLRLTLAKDTEESPIALIELYASKERKTILDEADSTHIHAFIKLKCTEIHLTTLETFTNKNFLKELLVTGINPDHHDGRRFIINMPFQSGADFSLECRRMIVAEVRTIH